GAEDELAAAGLEEVDGADGGVEAALDEPDDVAERLVRVVAVRNELADLLQGQEQGAFVGGAGRAHVRCCRGPRALDNDGDAVWAKGLSSRRTARRPRGPPSLSAARPLLSRRWRALGGIVLSPIAPRG